MFISLISIDRAVMGGKSLVDVGVNPKCPNASNPYHRCTQACSQNPPHHSNSTIKKIKEERRTYKDCPKASNPYHHCDHNCYKTLSHSGNTPPLKFEGKKKLGSKPEPPVLDSSTVPPSKVGDVYLSHDNKNTIVEPIQIPDVMAVHHKDQIKDVAEHIGNPLQTKQQDQIASHELVETQSVVVSESRISVGRYDVKESFASILRSILDKYGDIGATCHLESVVMRSYYVECVCFVVQQIQSLSSIIQLTNSKLQELLAIVNDVESAQLRVAWLRSALHEIAENIQLVNQHQEAESLRKDLQSELENLAQKEKEVADIKTRIPEIRDRLSELELKSDELDNSMLSVKSKLDNLPLKSLIDELL